MAASPSTLALGNPPLAFDRPHQVRAAVVTLAFVLAFWNVLYDMGYRWFHESDWSHGFVIPFFSMWLVHLRWERIKKTPVRHTWVGLVLMLGALAAYQLAVWGVGVFAAFAVTRQLAMWVCVLGVVIFLCGLPVVRHTWVAWAYLLFAVPWPQRFYSQVTGQLRMFAASLASKTLGLLPGLEMYRSGTALQYFYKDQNGRIDVEDACSGMRSTVTLCALGVAVTFMSDRPMWQRVVMLVSCVPIAIFCNFLRVIITSLLHIFVDPKYAHGTYHTALGLLMILTAFGLFTALGWLLDRLFVEEGEEGPSGPEPAASA